MNTKPAPDKTPSPDGMSDAVRKHQERRRRWAAEGEPSLMRFVGQIGVLGWIIVAPTLLALFIGRWLDHRFNTGIFWSAPLLMVGAGLGCWSAWQWMHKQ